MLLAYFYYSKVLPGWFRIIYLILMFHIISTYFKVSYINFENYIFFCVKNSYVGPPIVGLLFDQTQSYTAGFLFAGANICLSGFMLFFIPTLQRHIAKKQTRREIKHGERA